MRLIIAGGRNFFDYEQLEVEALKFIGDAKSVTIISGLARGADSLACDFAAQHELPLEGFHAEWNKYGRSAGVRRNKLMAKNATHLLAFWNGKSRGTMHMIDFATSKGLVVKVVEYRIPDKVLEKQVWDGIRRDNLI